MYGLVLLTAMSVGADGTPAPAPHPAPVVVSYGCGSCLGSCFGSCTGCYGSCSGYSSSCYGSCHGGLFHGHKSGMFGHHRASCYGSCSGCSGYSCSGWNCFGSCTGYAGVPGGPGSMSATGIPLSMAAAAGPGIVPAYNFPGYTSSCFGYGVLGYSTLGGNCYGFGSLPGTPFQCHGGGFSGGAVLPVALPPYNTAGYGWGYGPPYIYGNPYAVYGVVSRPPTMGVPEIPKTGDSKPMEKPMEPMEKKGNDSKNEGGMGATVKFRLPAEANLYVDGRLTLLSGSERSFTTPPLDPGQRFFYDVRAEVVIDGKPVVEEKRVIVEAGAKLTESFTTLIIAAANKPSAVAGK
jgi:uncharacterized protein (TIGR03000 family)